VSLPFPHNLNLNSSRHNTITLVLVPTSNTSHASVEIIMAPGRDEPGGEARGPPTAKPADIIRTYRPTKLFGFQKANTSVTSMDFDDSGELLLASMDDDCLKIYDVKHGEDKKTLYSKKYGCHLARFTHQNNSIIYASTKIDSKKAPGTAIVVLANHLQIPSDTSRPTTTNTSATSLATLSS
jgi:hypothetical protein